MPSAVAAIVPAAAATPSAPSTPPATPPPTQTPRRAAPWLAAMTMPTISAASSTSRKTMIAVASIGLCLFHHKATTRRAVEVVKEFVGAGIERADKDADLAAGLDDLLAMQHGALEFRVDGLLVLDD